MWTTYRRVRCVIKLSILIAYENAIGYLEHGRYKYPPSVTYIMMLDKQLRLYGFTNMDEWVDMLETWQIGRWRTFTGLVDTLEGRDDLKRTLKQHTADLRKWGVRGQIDSLTRTFTTPTTNLVHRFCSSTCYTIRVETYDNRWLPLMLIDKLWDTYGTPGMYHIIDSTITEFVII